MPNISRRILVADDDPVYREVAAEALENAGHKVMSAQHGGEAIKMLAAEHFDAAIVDLSMPVADGLQVIASIRSGTKNPHIPVIVITGHDDAIAVGRAYTAGATSFLTKPLNWVLFTPHVEFVLRASQTEDELRQASAAAAFLSNLKSQMMSALAGEFQAPIKTIFGFSELMSKEVYGALPDRQYKDMADEMSRASQNLSASLLKLMHSGQSLANQLELKEQAIDLNEAIADASTVMAHKSQARGVTLKTEAGIPAGTMLKADPALFRQALRSILDNAIRMSPRGGVVELHANLIAGNRLSIWASDEGPAIAADLMAEINGTKTGHKTFLQRPETRDVGIQVAKILTEAHQGVMHVRSESPGSNVLRLEFPGERVVASSAVEAASHQGEATARLAAIGTELVNDPRLRAWGNDQVIRGTAPAATPSSTRDSLGARRI